VTRTNRFFYVNENADYQLGSGLFVLEGIVSAVKTVEFVSYTLSYITLRVL
jgi:hypothetical protein